MRKRLVQVTLLASLLLGGMQAAAHADPEPGSNTGNSFVCNGNNENRPPTCPPRND